MLRAVLGVIVGYIVMAAVVAVLFTVAWLILGQDGAFKPGSYEIKLSWVILAAAFSLAAAVLGGLCCGLVARPPSKAAIALIVVVLALGFAQAVFVLATRPDDGPPAREADVSMMDAMGNAQEPTYLLILTPILGAVGVWFGASLLNERKPAPAAE